MTDCLRTNPPTALYFWKNLSEKVFRQRVPVSGSLELTRRCPLRCLHCYAAEPGRSATPSAGELPTRRWLELIDEIRQAGCLYLLLTGGEPLVHPDFDAIYRQARSAGLIVTVFSSGCHLPVDHLDLLTEFPPLAVEITLYGATAATHDRITGVAGSHDRTLRNVRRLMDRQLRVKLKTILMTENAHELTALEQLAADLHVPFRFDAALFPRFNGDRSPVQLRVPPAEAVARELASPERRERWLDFRKRMQAVPRTSRLYPCGAGMTTFHVTATGRLQPCLLMDALTADLRTVSFFDGWTGTLADIRTRTLRPDSPCTDCEAWFLCGYCPAFFTLETGDEHQPSEYLCAVGHHRRESLETYCEGYGCDEE